jgi:hypothetical protein
MVSTTFCISGMVFAKAGSGYSTDLNTKFIGSDFCIDVWITEAESVINSICRYNFTDNYSSLNVDTKKILQETASALAAIYSIQYDMSGYTSRTEAEDMINILRDVTIRNLSILRDKKVQDFINGS